MCLVWDQPPLLYIEKIVDFPNIIFKKTKAIDKDIAEYT